MSERRLHWDDRPDHAVHDLQYHCVRLRKMTTET